MGSGCFNGVDGCLCCSGCEGWAVSATVVLIGISVAVSVRGGWLACCQSECCSGVDGS